MAESNSSELELEYWMIRYYYHIDPATLSDAAYANALVFLEKIRKMEAMAYGLRNS